MGFNTSEPSPRVFTSRLREESTHARAGSAFEQLFVSMEQVHEWPNVMILLVLAFSTLILPSVVPAQFDAAVPGVVIHAESAFVTLAGFATKIRVSAVQHGSAADVLTAVFRSVSETCPRGH